MQNCGYCLLVENINSLNVDLKFILDKNYCNSNWGAFIYNLYTHCLKHQTILDSNNQTILYFPFSNTNPMVVIITETLWGHYCSYHC